MKRTPFAITVLMLLHHAANAQPAAGAVFEEPGAQCWAVASAHIVPGSGYAPGTYNDVALSGGAGVEARADITVDSSGKVVSVKLHHPGRRFVVGDALTAPIGASGSGFALTVESLMNVPVAGKEHDRQPPRCIRPAPANQATAPRSPGMPMLPGAR
jgi:hypothetical protein